MNKAENSSPEAIVLAAQIEQIKTVIYTMDLGYMKDCVKKMEEQASFQDSAAVLNPHHNSEKSTLIRDQARTLWLLCEFVDGLKKCEVQKAVVNNVDYALNQLSKLFW